MERSAANHGFFWSSLKKDCSTDTRSEHYASSSTSFTPFPSATLTTLELDLDLNLQSVNVRQQVLQ